MKKLTLALAASALAFTASAASASDSDSKDLTVKARVADECSLEAPSNMNFGRLAIERAPGSDALLLTTAFDNEFQDVWVSCNYAAKITITSDNQGLVNQDQVNDGPDSEDFTDKLNYGLYLLPSDDDFLPVYLQTTTASTRFRDQTDAFHDLGTIRAVIPQAWNPNRPLSGDYADTATISLSPI